MKKFKNAAPQTHVISDLNVEGVVQTIHEKGLKKANQTEFSIEKIIKRNGVNYMSNGKVMIICLITGSTTKTYLNGSIFS